MKKVLHTLKPDILMVFVQIAFSAVNVVFKLAINDGMSMRIASAYRFAFASAFTVPVALIFDRKKRPKITWRVLILAFLCGLFGGSLFINLYLEALELTSATFMSAMVNLNPAITFILAISFGFEKLNLKVAEGRAKVIGTIIGISGAMVMTFFRGIEINIWSSKINLMHPHQNQNGHVALHHADFRSKLLGISCAIGSSCFFSSWFIIQAKMNAEYPSPRSSTALMTTMAAIQATAFTLCVERDWNQWKLGFNIRLLTVVYSGIVVSGIAVVIIAWCIKKRGPLFASVFNPLQILLVDIAAYLTLDEKLYLGSVLGAVMIVCGLYMVLWGNAQELKKKSRLVALGNTTRGESENVEVVSPALRSQ
uniref:WAT1-related protein n=2 Tax=Cajanus cajan TaxID=3821 RepID=A0A151RHR6_CAJCA|nr:Auxin-induced protein 5NG4 [Cajanus cajan]